MGGEGSIGPPSLHIFSFQLWQARLSASRINASPTRRFCSDCSARSSSWCAPSRAPLKRLAVAA
jgi:hypothetical protein